MSNAGGENVDVANALLGVAFNLAIFAAGVIGAILIGTAQALVLPIFMITLALVALLVASTRFTPLRVPDKASPVMPGIR